MKLVQDLNLKNKLVLLRCDFNVPLDEKANILDDFRIERNLPTIKYLLKQGAKVILLSHLGQPPRVSRYTSRYLSRYSLKPVVQRLEQLLKQPVKFFSAVRDVIPDSRITLLENLRFHKGEEENDPVFARQLAKLGEIYINDAFSVCHRKHASIVGLAKLLPSAGGLLLQEEVRTLSQIVGRTARPLIVIIGGVKLETKIKLIENFLKKADHLLLGGKVANNLCLNSGFKHRVELTNPKLHLPIDNVIALKTLEKGYKRIGSWGSVRKEEAVFDIGPETIKMFSEIIKQSKTIFWSGPLGYIEDERFTQGSLAVAEAIIRARAFSIVGGGDTNSFLAEHGLRERFSYLCTGGGAMLEFLSGNKLPGLEALK